ncbi:hypothetical protein CYMTET_29937 [Cymbomonas tetramitiformis]|uniref:Uncharacterized protein n=1 Tax=Cymbomonas tetramitiformis TaxID=36881 RepID=A0AAE0FJT9_9CHLO|nr:hypothetical protein CYMTET_29937 [Cymbomonas tetramitiformis]
MKGFTRALFGSVLLFASPISSQLSMRSTRDLTHHSRSVMRNVMKDEDGEGVGATVVYEAKHEDIPAHYAVKYTIQAIYDGRQRSTLSWSMALQLWQDDSEFRIMCTNVLRRSSFPAFFWETPPLTQADLQSPFEFVLVNSPQLVEVR